MSSSSDGARSLLDYFQDLEDQRMDRRKAYSDPLSKKRSNGPEIPRSVIDYCWKPYFSRPPPLRDLGADLEAAESLAQLLRLESPANRTEYASHGLINRLMEPWAMLQVGPMWAVTARALSWGSPPPTPTRRYGAS